MGIFSKKTDAVPEKKSVQSAAKPAETQKVAVLDSPAARAYGLIVSPIVTEKSHAGMTSGKYTFRVTKQANKKSIARLIADLHEVRVKSVNIVSVPKKRCTVKYDRGYQSAYKKAIVTLHDGERIAELETA